MPQAQKFAHLLDRDQTFALTVARCVVIDIRIHTQPLVSLELTSCQELDQHGIPLQATVEKLIDFVSNVQRPDHSGHMPGTLHDNEFAIRNQ